MKIAQRIRSEVALSWRSYRDWNRACLLNAWRATRGHFGRGPRSLLEVIGPGLLTTLALSMGSADAELHRDVATALAAGVMASALWMLAVLCWNFGLAPYRLWRAARSRIMHLQLTIGRRIDRQVIARELELRIREGVALMNGGTPSQTQLAEWYERVLRVVSRASDRERAMLEAAGPAPGTRGGALEMLILSNRIEKLRLILERQHTARTARRRRAQAAATPINRSVREAYVPPRLRRAGG